jgi:hypothetical protein
VENVEMMCFGEPWKFRLMPANISHGRAKVFIHRDDLHASADKIEQRHVLSEDKQNKVVLPSRRHKCPKQGEHILGDTGFAALYDRS